ncbi:MAG: SpoIIE family protein phosphatase [Sphingobacteriaceae bacterium]|nr:SpoIIE family protein phosphatase [Sphingobacteriaceae bacterium]
MNIDSLKAEYAKQKGTEAAVQLLVNISNTYSKNEFDSSIHYAKLIFTATTNKRMHAKADRLIGYAYFNKTNFRKALDHYFLAATYYESINNDTLMAQVYNNIGQMFYYNYNKKMAKEYWIKAMEKCKAVKNESYLSDILNNLGAICWDEKNYKKAIEYYEESAAIDLKKGDYASYAGVINNIGMAYSEVFEVSNDMISKNMSQAYYLKSLRIIDSLPYNIYSVQIYLSVAGALVDFERNSLALMVIKKAEAKMPKVLNKEYLNFLNTKARVLLNNKKPVDAYLCLKRYVVIKDSLFTLDANAQMLEAEARYENDKQTKEIELQKSDIERKNLKLRQSTIVGYSLGIGVLLLIVIAFMTYRRYAEKQKANKIISFQKEEVESKKLIIEEKQREIIDSINYAKRIQYSLLANEQLLKNNLCEYFIFFNPKDIVSGDFYWATKKDNKFYMAVCDSTGHGVPGAFMSLLSIGSLSEAINENNITEPNEVFEYVRKRLIESMEGQRDGFDGVLLCIDESKKKVIYASAHNGPVLVRDGTIKELDADKMPVGMGVRDEPFKKYSIDVQKGDRLYLYTDGFADQFGGPKKKKFKYKQLNEILLFNCMKPMSEQREILKQTFNDWKGELEQVDDVCVIGIHL